MSRARDLHLLPRRSLGCICRPAGASLGRRAWCHGLRRSSSGTRGEWCPGWPVLRLSQPPGSENCSFLPLHTGPYSWPLSAVLGIRCAFLPPLLHPLLKGLRGTKTRAHRCAGSGPSLPWGLVETGFLWAGRRSGFGWGPLRGSRHPHGSPGGITEPGTRS